MDPDHNAVTQSSLQIDVADSSLEGQTIVTELTRAGFQVRNCSISKLHDGTSAAVVLLAGDSAGAEGAIRALRATPENDRVHVVLLGLPRHGEAQDASGNLWGADEYFPRPVDAQIVVQTLVKFANEHSAPSRRAASVFSDGESVANLGPQEMQLQQSDIELSPAYLVEPTKRLSPQVLQRPENSLEYDSHRNSLHTDEWPQDFMHVPAPVSVQLSSLLYEADRRMFPSLPSMELRFEGSDESPEALVPSELLDWELNVLESSEDDPLDAITFTGFTSFSTEHMPLQADQAAHPYGKQELGVDPQNFFTAGEIVSVLWPVIEQSIDSEMVVLGEQGNAVRMVIVSGVVKSVEGDEYDRVKSSLQRRGLSVKEQTDDPQVWLETAVEQGVVSRMDLERQLRLARESLVEELVIQHGRYSLIDLDAARRAEYEDRQSPLGVPLVELLLRGAQKLLTRHWLSENLSHLVGEQGIRKAAGASEERSKSSRQESEADDAGDVVLSMARPAPTLDGVRLRLTPQVYSLMKAARLPPEVVGFVERTDGQTLSDVIEQAEGEDGLVGLIAGLLCANSLLLQAMPFDPQFAQEQSSKTRELLLEQASKAHSGNYYTILGIDPGSDPEKAKVAFRNKRQQIEALRLSALGLQDMESARQRVLRAYDDAIEVLGHPRLNSLYAASM